MKKQQKSAKAAQKHKDDKQKYEKSRFKVRLRYTRSEEEILKRHAEKAGKEIATYVRDISLNPRFKIVPAIPKVNVETKAQIQRIGVNLNQMARAMNNYYETKNFDRIEENLRKISDELHGILTSLRA
jgi:hypothetical protein